jgi:hypothetical protein
MESVVELKINYLNDKFHELLRLKSFSSFGSINMHQYATMLKIDLNSIICSLEIEICSGNNGESLDKFNNQIISQDYAANRDLMKLLESLEKLKSVILNEVEDILDDNKQVSFYGSVYTSLDGGSFTNELNISRAWSPVLVDKSPLLGFEHDIEYSEGSVNDSSFDESSICIAGSPTKTLDQSNNNLTPCLTRMIRVARKTSTKRHCKGVVAVKQEGSERWSFLWLENDDTSDWITRPTDCLANQENEIQECTPSLSSSKTGNYVSKKTKAKSGLHYLLTHN